MKQLFKAFSPILFITLFASFSIPTNAQNTADRIGNSPYPVSAVPDTLFMVSINNMTADQAFTVVTLQGILAKTKPRIMVERSSPQYLQDALNYGITYDSTFYHDFTGLMNHFKSSVSGYLLCNINDTSTNAAISVCSFYNAVVATPADSSELNSIGLPLLYNLQGNGATWSFDTFENRYSKRVCSYQDWTKQSYLSDYSIFSNAYTCYGIPQIAPVNYLFQNLLPNSVMIGWGTDEFTSVDQASQSGVMVHASDWVNNLTTFSNMNAQPVQKNRSADTLIKPGTHTVCFVMTDGDNIQWLLGDFVNDPGTYGSTHRGQVPLGWTISPALAELCPTCMKYIYDTAATGPVGQDYFISGPSGMGYFYPDGCTPLGLDSAANITGRMMKKANLSIVNVIGTTFADQYFRPYLEQPDIDAVFYYTYYGGYQGQLGQTMCVNGKPVISARYSMWTGFYNAETLAQTIDTMPKDPNSPDGYSLVDVHVFGGGSVDSVILALSLLDSNIRVVTPDAFVKLYKAGVNCDTTITTGVTKISTGNRFQLMCQPNPVSGQAKVTFSLNDAIQSDLSLYDMLGNKIMSIASGLQSAGEHSVDFSLASVSSGVYLLNMTGGGASVSQKVVVVK